jgi:hypothetical protein
VTTQRQRPAAQDGPEDTAGKKSEGLRIWLLGGFRVSAGERSIEDERWRLRKARSLVKLLALTPGHRMHREQVAAWLWPDADPIAFHVRSSERLCLRKVLACSVMRGGLPEAVPSARPSKPRRSQRSKSGQTLARLRPV